MRACSLPFGVYSARRNGGASPSERRERLRLRTAFQQAVGAQLRYDCVTPTSHHGIATRAAAEHDNTRKPRNWAPVLIAMLSRNRQSAEGRKLAVCLPGLLWLRVSSVRQPLQRSGGCPALDCEPNDACNVTAPTVCLPHALSHSSRSGRPGTPTFAFGSSQIRLCAGVHSQGGACCYSMHGLVAGARDNAIRREVASRGCAMYQAMLRTPGAGTTKLLWCFREFIPLGNGNSASLFRPCATGVMASVALRPGSWYPEWTTLRGCVSWR